jgi:tRNA(fMet)-specific endonuclease VapC
MAHRYLLDTNILSDLVRCPQGGVAERVTRAGVDTVCTSIVVASELRFGALKSGSRRLVRQSELILSAIDILPLDEPADEEYARLRLHLESRGSLIGSNDMLIAAHALSLNCTLVTANEREFARVPGLGVENWLLDS